MLGNGCDYSSVSSGFATALAAQGLVGAIAIELPNTAGATQILIVHGVFVLLFAGAALLFRHAARKGFVRRRRVLPIA